MASSSTPPPRAASSASTLYEWPCSGSLMPRYSRRKCAASNRASTRTVKLRMFTRENVLDHLFAHPELAQLFRRRLRSQQIFGALIVPAVVRTMSLRQVDERQQRLFARLVEHGAKCTMRADFTMPLPKSVTCSNCRKTYPEGWKRCPYCGFDEARAKQESQSRRYMQQKMREWETRTGKQPARRDERGERERPRPQQRGDRRPQPQQQQQQASPRVRDQRQQQ